jgi:2-polyprenyl-3-methyl-5-hydroxy-6-metoxy-1,4-benzoquinol methylase
MTRAEKIEAQPPAAAAEKGCTACGGQESRVRFPVTDRLYGTTRKTFHIVECRRCGLLRLSPQPSPQEFDAYYPKRYWFDPAENAASRMEERYRRLVLRDHLQFVERALSEAGEAGPVLDVGCGGGLFLGMLRERGYKVLGLDVSEKAAGLAWQRHHVPAITGELAAAPVAPASCAAITMFHVLEHVPQPQAYLAETYTLLSPKGRLIVQVPNAASWQFALLGRQWNGVDAPRHLHLFRAADMERMIEAAGFQVVRRKHFSLRDNPAGLATSIAPSLDPMARRIREIPESAATRLLKDLAYFVLVAAALPFTLLEAAFGAGSTIMIEARKRAQ